MSIAALPLPLPRRSRGGGSGSLFFITVAHGATATVYFLLPSRRGSNFLFSVVARQWQMFSRDGHLCGGEASNITVVCSSNEYR
jgi:hypothetical protein